MWIYFAFILLLRYSVSGQWKNLDNSIYFFGEETLSWSEAQQYCRRLGANLAAISSEREHNFLVANSRYTESWIGLQNKGNCTCFTATPHRCQHCRDSWAWVGGTPMTYQAWHMGEPQTSQCGRLRDNGWADNPCSFDYAFICERELCSTLQCDHGVCEVRNGTARCDCDPGYSGNQCQDADRDKINNNNNNKLSTAALVGIGLACGVLGVGTVILLIVLAKKKILATPRPTRKRSIYRIYSNKYESPEREPTAVENFYASLAERANPTEAIQCESGPTGDDYLDPVCCRHDPVTIEPENEEQFNASLTVTANPTEAKQYEPGSAVGDYLSPVCCRNDVKTIEPEHKEQFNASLTVTANPTDATDGETGSLTVTANPAEATDGETGNRESGYLAPVCCTHNLTTVLPGKNDQYQTIGDTFESSLLKSTYNSNKTIPEEGADHSYETQVSTGYISVPGTPCDATGNSRYAVESPNKCPASPVYLEIL